MRTPASIKYRPLLMGAIGLVALPLVMPLLGLTVNTASVIVILSIAALGLNLMMGFTGLISFGHAAWFGIGGYAAGLAQLNWLPGQIILPSILAVFFVAALAVVGALLLRRRGVYFALMTLALCALVYTVCFRWTAVTGGEDGLGNLKRGTFGPIQFDDPLVYYTFLAVTALAVLYGLLRVIRSPFGHVLVAIRENQQRATFQGYPVDRYKLAVFVLSAAITALAGALSAFQHYLVSAEVGVRRLLRTASCDGGDRRNAQHSGAGPRRAVLHPVPRAVLDLDQRLAVLVRPGLRRLRAVLAARARRHLGYPAAPLAAETGRGRRHEPPQHL